MSLICLFIIRNVEKARNEKKKKKVVDVLERMILSILAGSESGNIPIILNCERCIEIQL